MLDKYYPNSVGEWKEMTQHIKGMELVSTQTDANNYKFYHSTITIEGKYAIDFFVNDQYSDWAEKDGMYNLDVMLTKDGTNFSFKFLEKSFKDPLNPTDNERTLFELENDMPYFLEVIK